MITQIEIRNLRLFGEEGALFKLRPISVFCGTNSSGKSTVLKSLLFLRQSLEGIRFIGDDVDLGDYSSLVFRREKGREITIGLTIENIISYETYTFLRSLRNEPIQDTMYGDQQPSNETEFVPYQLESYFTFSATRESFESDEQLSLFVSEERLKRKKVTTPQVILSSARHVLSVHDRQLLTWTVFLARTTSKKNLYYDILIPKEYFDGAGGTKLMDAQLSEEGKFYKTRALVTGFLTTGLIAKRHVGEGEETDEKGRKEELDWFPLPPTIVEVQDDLRRELNAIEYLGPLRTPAKRYYITTFDSVPRSDPEGKFLPYTLLHQQRTKVLNLRPGENKERQEYLSIALNGWLYYMRTGAVPPAEVYDEIEVSVIEDVLVKFNIKSIAGKELYALADSGFGYSQVLPILVKGLLMDVASILVVEQPELHLNPALQVRLAEFFVSMIQIGKQVIIETHSEHIVNAIRVFSAEDESDKLSRQCGIFYFSTKGEQPVIHELSIKADGTVPEWPHEFFGEAASLTGRLLRAQKHLRMEFSERDR